MCKLSIPTFAVGIGVGGIKHSIQGMIGKQESFDGKYMRCLGIDGIFRGWPARQSHFLLLTICIDREEQLVLITPVDDSAKSLFRGGEELVLVDDHIQKRLDCARGKVRSPQVITWVCSKNQRSVAVEGPLLLYVHLCLSKLRKFGELHENMP